MNTKRNIVLLIGEHRSTEKMPILLGKRLKEELGDKVTLLEYREWKISDYVYCLKNWHDNLPPHDGIHTQKEFDDFERKNFKENQLRLRAYGRELYEEYGPYLFNLHRRDKNEDFSFHLSHMIPNREILKALIQEVSNNHKIRSEILFASSPNDKSKIHVFTHDLYTSTVEIPLPNFEEFSTELPFDESLTSIIKNPYNKGAYRADNINHPYVKELFEKKYLPFMEDLILELI
jgi:hypothetical protein